MTVEKPFKGAKLFNKRRFITIILVLLCSCLFVFWQQSPAVNIHNQSTEALLYKLMVAGKEVAVGQIPANTDYKVPLPFWQGRNAMLYFQAKAKDKVISFSARTPKLGELDFYINPSLQISLEQIPLGFIPVEEEIK